MINLNKEEYMYLIIVRIQKDNDPIDFDVHIFKSETDAKVAMLNMISNNARNCKHYINGIFYDDKAILNINIVALAEINFSSGISKRYECVRRCIEEVK